MLANNRGIPLAGGDPDHVAAAGLSFAPLQSAGLPDLLAEVLRTNPIAFAAVLLCVVLFFLSVLSILRKVTTNVVYVVLTLTFTTAFLGFAYGEVADLFGTEPAIGLVVGFVYGGLAKLPDLKYGGSSGILDSFRLFMSKVGLIAVSALLIVMLQFGLPPCPDGGGLCLRTLLVPSLFALVAQSAADMAFLFLGWVGNR